MTPARRLLLVFDDGAAGAFGADVARACRPDVVELLPLTSDPGIVSRVRHALEGLSAVTIADSGRLLDDEARRLRDVLPHAIAATARAIIGSGSVAAALTMPGRGSFLWLTPFAERNPLVSRFLTTLAQLGVVEHRLATAPAVDAVAVCVEADELRRSVGMTARARSLRVWSRRGARARWSALRSALVPLTWGAVALRLAAGAVAARWRLGRPEAFSRDAVVFATYFPAVDAEAAAEGRFRDRYFQPLADVLQARGVRVEWLLLPEPIDRWRFIDALGLAARFRAHARMAPWHQWLSPPALRRAIAARGRAVRWYRANRAALESAATAAFGCPAARPILSGALRKSLFGARAFTAAVMREAFAEALAAGQPKAVVYCAEFQPWEAALCDVAARRDVRTIGFQHTIVPPNMFNYRRSPDEQLPAADGGYPLPSTVAVNGERPARILKQGTLPDVRVVEAIRHRHVPAPLRRSAAKIRDIVVIGSIDHAETRALLDFVAAARPLAGDRRFAVRLHPLGRVPVTGHWEEADEPLPEVLAGASVIIVASSSVAVEGIASGCDVIQPLLAGTLSTAPLDACEGWHRAISSVDELAAALRVRHVPPGDPAALIREFWHVGSPDLPRWNQVLGT